MVKATNWIIVFFILIAMTVSGGYTVATSPVKDTDLGEADASFEGEAPDDQAGYCVAGVGDVNGDGYDDIIIGAPGEQSSLNRPGKVYLIFGRQSGWSMGIDLSLANASIIGESNGDHAGSSVAGAGDVNNDGYDDFLIGAYKNDGEGSNRGQVYLFFGKASGWQMDMDISSADASFRGETDGDSAGISVAGVGDVNGDGFDDILIGADSNDEGIGQTGQSYLVLGGANGWSMNTSLSDANASFWGENAKDRSGGVVSGAGDVNGDGYSDFLISARLNGEGGNQAGQVYLIFGRASGWSMDTRLASANASFWGEAPGDRAGHSIAGAGDVNGDGYDDFLCGSIENSEGGDKAGQTYLIFGRATGWSMDTNLSSVNASFWGEAMRDRSGCSIAGAGDVNVDGYNDFLIGAYYSTGGPTIAGETYLILGMASGWSMDINLSDANASFLGEHYREWTGFSVSGAGDVNGNGADDILIGGPGEGPYSNYIGWVYLVFYVDGMSPIWDEIPTLTAIEDVPFTYDFSGNVSDPDSPALDLHLSSPSKYVTSISGKEVTFLFPNGVLSANITLLVWDGEWEVSTTVNFTVQPVNDPPEHNIPIGQTAREKVPWTMNLRSYVWDIDNDKEDLILLVDSPYASVEGLNLTMNFTDTIDEYDLWFNVSDGIDAIPARLHFTIFPAPTPPSVPMDFKAIGGDGTVALEWRAPVDDGDSPILGYRVYRGPTGEDLTIIGNVDADMIGFTDGNLTNGHVYFYALVAFNVFGHSVLTDVLSVMPAGPPGAPRAFSVTPGNGSVNLSWEPPDFDGGEPLVSYRILKGTSESVLEFLSDAYETTYLDQDVENGRSYWYQVRAETNAGIGPGTSILEAMPVGAPAPSTITAFTPLLYSIYISWTEPSDDGGNPITGYRIYRGESRDTMELLTNASGDTLEYTDTGLKGGKEYHYQLSALNNLHEGPRSMFKSGYCHGLPSAPVNFVLTPGDGIVELEWSPPEYDGELQIIGYTIKRGTEPGTLPELARLDDVSSYTDDTVENGVTYYYAIAAINEEGDGESSSSEGVTPEKTQFVPGRVTVGEPKVTKKSVTLNWTAPLDDGGSPVKGYIIYRGDTVDALEMVVEVGGSEKSWTDGNVSKGRTYWYTIAPRNAVGEGDTVEAFEVKIPRDKDEEPGFSSISSLLVFVIVALLLVARRARPIRL